MNFDNLITWIVGIVVATAISGSFNTFQQDLWIAQLKLIKASQTKNWGSPRFFPSRLFTNEKESPVSLLITKEGELKQKSKQPTSKEVQYEN